MRKKPTQEQLERGAAQLKRRMDRLERGEGPPPCPKCGNTNKDKRLLGVSKDKQLEDHCGECGHSWIEELPETERTH